MRISIALCTYNGAKYLPEQLASIAAQTRLPDELIVCDDGSTDVSVDIVREFAATAPFSVQLSQNAAHLGTIRNFARAIVECSGDLTFLCDHDDVWHRDKIAVMLRAFDGDPELAAVFTNARQIDASGLVLERTLWEHIGFTAREQRRFDRRAFEVLADRNVVTGATLAFRDRWRKAILPFPDVAGMLHDQWIAIVLAGVARVGRIEDAMIDYRLHDTQQVGSGEAASGVRRWVGAARDTGAAEYSLKAQQLEAVLHRLERIGAQRDRIDYLRGKIAHLRMRASLPSRKIARLPVVTRELATLRYFRYSNHLWSAAKDLFW